MYTKLSKISQYTAKTQELGKIINMLSNDLNAIELKGPLFFSSLITPLALIGIVAILITRLGWAGISCLGIIIILMPIQACIGKINGRILEKVNASKDKRVKMCSEIIEGIKFIKLYGWELAFKRLIQNFRTQEVKDYVKLSVGRALQRALGNCTSILASFGCFMFMHFSQYGK